MNREREELARAEDFDAFEDPLFEAVRTGTLEEVHAAIDVASGFVNRRDHGYDFTALEFALSLGRLDVVALLLERGADPNHPSANDSSALASAAALPADLAIPAIRALREYGARLCIPDPAIRVAGSTGSLAVLDCLLETPAQLRDDGDDDEMTDATRDSRRAVDLLDEPALNAAFGALLAGAARRGDVATMDTVLARIPRLGSDRPYLAWAYDAAAAALQFEAWERLVQLGAPDKARALTAALGAYAPTTRENATRMIRAVLALEGPDVTSSLLFSTSHDDGLLDLALALGADVEARGPRGETPLMLAAQYHQVTRMKRLIAAGSDALCEDDAGNNLRAYASLWPLSVNASATQSFLAELGLTHEAWRGALPQGVPGAPHEPPPGSSAELWAVGVGCSIGVAIVAIVLLLHVVGLL